MTTCDPRVTAAIATSPTEETWQIGYIGVRSGSSSLLPIVVASLGDRPRLCRPQLLDTQLLSGSPSRLVVDIPTHDVITRLHGSNLDIMAHEISAATSWEPGVLREAQQGIV